MAERVREGRLVRLVGMARAGASVARGMLEQDAVAPLARAVDTLAELRGLGTKVGQMAGIWSAMLPEDQRVRAEPLLARLRAGTMRSRPEEVRALAEAELGGSLAELFASFDDQPFASASIGQVHRAALHDGTPVAVKIQHPGIDVALRADLDHAAHIGGVAGLFMLPGGGAEVVAEVRARIEAELDYRCEAAWLDRFAEITRGDDAISVPALVRDRSSERVLTTTFVDGETVDAAAARPTARAQGRAIRRFLLDAWIEHGLLFADPHAGNWIFHPEGRVTVLDFGSVVPFAHRDVDRLDAAVEAIRRGDSAAAERALTSLLASDLDALALGLATPRPLARAVRLALTPLVLDRPATTTHLRELADATARAKRAMLGRRAALPVWLPLTLRALVGTTALLVSLEGPGALEG